MYIHLQIRGGDRLAAFPMAPEKILHVTDVVSLLRTISELHLCEGNGYGEYCPEVFFASAVKPKTNRCDTCRSNRKRQYLNKWRNEQRAAIQKGRDKRAIKNLKRKLGRREKIVRLSNARFNGIVHYSLSVYSIYKILANLSTLGQFEDILIAKTTMKWLFASRKALVFNCYVCN